MSDKEKLLALLEAIPDHYRFEDIFYRYMYRYKRDFTAGTINNMSTFLSNEILVDKITSLENSARVSEEYGEYLKNYLEGKTFIDEESARANVDAQIKNAQHIINIAQHNNKLYRFRSE